MTTYAGEFTELIVFATIERVPGESRPLTGDDDVVATIDVWDSADTKVLDAAELLWDADTQSWRAPWDTTGLAAGSYETRATFIGPGPFKSWDYSRVRLTADRAPLETT